MKGELMMATLGRIMLAGIVASGLGLGLGLGLATAEAAAPIALKPSPPLAKGIAAFPRVVGTDLAAQRINKALAGAEQGLGSGLNWPSR